MIKIKAFFKAHLNKFIAALSALSISFTAAFTSLAPCASASSVTYADLLVDIASVSPAGAVVDYANLISDVYLFFFEDAVTSDREIQRTKILAAWKTITDNNTMTEDQFAAYWQQCIDELGLADDRLIMIEDTVRLGLTLEDVINYCYHSDGDGVSVSDTGDVQVTGRKFKQIVDYWHDYYKPKDNVNQFFFSYNTTEGTKYPRDMTFAFLPAAPAYREANGTWGGKNWSSCYILPFFVDDDLGDYYFQYYFHLYSGKSEEDDCNMLYVDVISLLDGSVYKSYSYVWDNFQTVTFNHAGSQIIVRSFPNNASYLSSTNENILLNEDYNASLFYSGALSSLSNIKLYDVRFTNTFTPDTNINDDIGYIMSSDPFVLWANDTSIETSKIPDDYLVTVTGDTVYDYSITNTAGDTTTINNYITNNYTVPEAEKPDSGGGSSGGGSSGGSSSVGGDITVSGDIGVSGSVDVNVNVNVSNSDTEYDPTIDSYVDALPEQSDTINNYFSIFFSYLPAPLLALLLSGVAAAILARLLGR